MTQPTTVSEQQLRSSDETPRVTRHDVTFRFQLKTLHGEAITEDTSVYKPLAAADDKMYGQLPREIPNWTYLDHDNIEGSRLEVYQPDYAGEDSNPGAAYYDISVGSTLELPLNRSDETQERPLSVQALMETVPAVLVRIYKEAGIEMTLSSVRFYKGHSYSSEGTYNLG